MTVLTDEAMHVSPCSGGACSPPDDQGSARAPRAPNGEELRTLAFALSPDEQIELAYELMQNAEPLSPEWQEEIQRRIDDIETGRVELIPGEEVHAEIEARHSSPTLPVLFYEEDGVAHAHAVEFGLAATGETLGKALVALSDAVLAEYAAAEFHSDPSLLSFDARPDIVQRHARARGRLLRRAPPNGDRATTLAMPSTPAIAERAASLQVRNIGEETLDGLRLMNAADRANQEADEKP